MNPPKRPKCRIFTTFPLVEMSNIHVKGNKWNILQNKAICKVQIAKRKFFCQNIWWFQKIVPFYGQENVQYKKLTICYLKERDVLYFW